MNFSHRTLGRGITWAASGTLALGMVAGSASASSSAPARDTGATTGYRAALRWVNGWQGSPTAGGTFSHASCPADSLPLSPPLPALS